MDSRKRSGGSMEGTPAKRSLRGGNIGAQKDGAPSPKLPTPNPQKSSLEALEPYDIIDHITSLLPSQALEASPVFTKAKYLQDIWTIFSESALIDPKLAEMHQQWFECRQPDVRELWQARYPAAGTKHTFKGSTRQATLRTVLTLERILAEVPQEHNTDLHRSFCVLYLDYLMLMCVMCLRSNYLPQARQYFPKFEEQFDDVVQLLWPALQEGEAPRSSDKATMLATTPTENQAMLEGLVVDPSAVKSLGKIAGCEAAKNAMKSASYIYTEMPHLIKEGYGCKNILLHGSPGTGKSTLARTLAVESKMQCYNVSISHLVEKWVGASERNVRYLFEIANTHAPSVIIFDGVNTICGTRKSGSNGTQRMTSELLTCMSRFPRVMVIGTTDRPWTLDTAFIYRFQKQIFVSLPTEAERRDLIGMALDRFPNSLGQMEIAEVARKTDGFTGDAIERCIKAVTGDMAMKLKGVTHFQPMQFRGQQRFAPAGSKDTPVSDLPDSSAIVPALFAHEKLLATVAQTASECGSMAVEEAKHARWSKQKFQDTS